MATVSDLLQSVQVSERWGETREVTSSFVIDVARVDPSTSTTRDIAQIITAALADESIPSVYAEWAVGGDVRVEERTATVVSLEASTVKVRIDLVYRLQRQGASPPERGGTSLQQVTRRTYPGLSPSQPAGAQITVGYNGETQGGEVNVLLPEDNFSIERVRSDNGPHVHADSVVGKVNKTAFAGASARQWLCVRCDYEAVNLASNPAWFRFTYEFAKAPTDDGWDPTVVYKDAVKGEVPPDLVQSSPPQETDGIKDIVAYQEVNFAGMFNLSNPVA